MLRLVAPKLFIDRVTMLDVARLRALGVDALLMDVDNTLKDYDVAEPGAEAREWAASLREAGIRLCLVSNGRETRIRHVAELLQVPFVAMACKPLPSGCRRAIEQLALPRERTALVGDQVFSDIIAGNLAGLFTILVRPTCTREPWFTRLKRPFERLLLVFLRPREPRR